MKKFSDDTIKKVKHFVFKHKIKLSLTIFLTIIAIFSIYNFTTSLLPKFIQKINYEKDILSFANKNRNSIFYINQITLFSSSDAKNKISSSKSNFTLENLYTYTDIAIFINKYTQENQLENTLKEVSIKNISIDVPSKEGQSHLYYKNLNDFATPYIPEAEALNDELTFKISANEITDFSDPILYNNCANPITLTYINENIKTDYTILDTTNPITYNGSLLKRCGIPLTKIASKISFDVFITNNKDEKFKSKVFISIPYETESNSIYDGHITIKDDVNFIFYRYE